MTREEAIEILNTYDVNFHNEDGKKIRADKICAAFDMAVKALEREQRWIPVSERLPKKFESVLVCFKSQGGMTQIVSERLTNMDGSNRWSALGGIEPIAWMPLPEPYKVESEGINEDNCC